MSAMAWGSCPGTEETDVCLALAIVAKQQIVMEQIIARPAGMGLRLAAKKQAILGIEHRTALLKRDWHNWQGRRRPNKFDCRHIET